LHAASAAEAAVMSADDRIADVIIVSSVDRCSKQIFGIDELSPGTKLQPE
jgi:hypothetical protein